ncbi:MAG: hypothetical protein ACI808_002711 [Paraglaciecola sp.]|jgi:hypothetical protein
MNSEGEKSLVPHITVGVIFVLIVVVIYFWPSEISDDLNSVTLEPEIAVSITPEPIPSEMLVPEPEPEEPEPLPPAPEPIPEPEPLDVSDGTVKTKLIQLSVYDTFARLLINDQVLQRFVIMTTSLANEEVSANNQVLVAPEKPFRTFQQAEKEWIDPASYKRYTPYVDVFESIEIQSLLTLYMEYKPAIEDIFAEISDPNDDFDETLIEAIDLLLDTPEVPVPVEVYTDSVMYKFSDRRLESLSAPQKQLLRTGPENMRRIKAKLRELKSTL